MERQIREADFVLLVCTESYARRVRGEEGPGVGRGVVWEANLIRNELYNARTVSRKFIPVLLAGGEKRFIPAPLQGRTHYRADDEEGYETLYRRLTDQPLTPRPDLGARRTLPPRARRSGGTGGSGAPHGTEAGGSDRGPVCHGQEVILKAFLGEHVALEGDQRILRAASADVEAAQRFIVADFYAPYAAPGNRPVRYGEQIVLRPVGEERFVSANESQPEVPLCILAEIPDTWERFTLERLPNMAPQPGTDEVHFGRPFNLKCHDGRWVWCNYNGDKTIRGDLEAPPDRYETFYFELPVQPVRSGHSASADTVSFTEIQKQALENQKQALVEEYQALNRQLVGVLGAAEELRIGRQMQEIERKLAEIELKLGQLSAGQGPAGSGPAEAAAVEGVGAVSPLPPTTGALDRGALFIRLRALPPGLLGQLIFTLEVPPGVVRGGAAPQAERVEDLLNWAASPHGPGLETLARELQRVLAHP
jgi:hypothetical protein